VKATTKGSAIVNYRLEKNRETNRKKRSGELENEKQSTVEIMGEKLIRKLSH
jgi:hypothetical protein